ncbi:MAG: glycoside hydrolase family 9 protein, partial [Ruminiclostridium sp.]|nr:glycoside hydrolase family 9 protein [Ruminiclostridium sp.]
GTTAASTSEAATAAETQPAPNKKTSKLSPNGGYEGREGTSTFNYGEALQKSIMFYDLQRSGDLPDDFRCNWRGDSCLKDGSDNGLDLSGGFYDAGDNVKFNLPMSYSMSLLAWSVVENRKEYEESGQLQYILDVIRWGNDYFIKCHPEPDVYYYQVGDGNADHGWWGPAEVVDVQMNRPSYKVDLQHGGSTVAAGTAAALASCAVVFKNTDKAYSDKCLKHAKELLAYAEKVSSDSGYTAANGFYQSYGGFRDEISFAAYWIYKATEDKDYLQKSRDFFGEGDANWALCWDDKSWGTALLLAKETGGQSYKDALERHLDYWCDEIYKTPKGLAYCDNWGALRYATTTAFVALSYAESWECPVSKAKKYKEFAKSQVDYALGSSGRSYVVGYGENYPKNPHHRTAHGSYTNNIGDPANTRHVLYGALVGGPDRNDSYGDDRQNYQNGEVATDYNAGFTGALAKLYKEYGGKTLKNFGAIETPDDELYTDATINVKGDDFIEIKALVYNKTAFPARDTNNLKLCYFFDISEIKQAGGSAKDLVVTTNYMQGGNASDVLCWNDEKNLYYVAIDFTGVDIYPGGQDSYKKEVQFRIRNTKGVWDNSNDPSFIDVGQVSSGTMTKALNMALYEGKTLVFGTEPNEKNTGDAIKDIKPIQNNNDNNSNNNNGGNSGGGYTGSGTVNNEPAVQVSDKGTVSVSLEQQQASGKGNTIAFSLKIKNTGSTGIDLSKLTADYLFTNDGGGDIVFECDYADIQGSGYQACTDTVSGSFSKASGDKADTKCTIKSSGVLPGGDTLTVNVRIHKSDWTEMDLGNDWSGANAEHITVTYNGKKL